MQLKRLTAPAKQVVTVNEVKNHLCLTDDFTEQESNIQLYIDAAVSEIDGGSGFLNRGLITQSWTGILDRFPSVFVIPLPPVQSVNEIRYIDTAGDTQILSAATYRVSYLGIDQHQALVERVNGSTWPSVDDVFGAVEIDFTVGYGTANTDLPAKIRQLVYFMVSSMFERRETTMEAEEDNPVYTGMIANARFWS